MKETGLGMTAAVLIDATVIRTLLVPATMRLLGPLELVVPWPQAAGRATSRGASRAGSGAGSAAGVNAQY